jgi:hypothetical protein
MELQFSNSTNANWQIQSTENGVSFRPLMLNPSGGNVGIGTSSPATKLHVSGTIRSSTGADVFDLLHDGTNGTLLNSKGSFLLYTPVSTNYVFHINEIERFRIDSSGKLLAGTSSPVNVGAYDAADIQSYFQSGGVAASIAVISTGNTANGSALHLAKSRGGTSTIVNNNDGVGIVRFSGADGTDIETVAAEIACFVDGTPGSNDMPGRLVFSTTADGAATPTERLRITSAGVLQVADAGNITVGTTTGTKIGTATTQKIGFYDATPVVQPTAVADATDAATVITQLNALLTRMRNLGLIAT